MDRYAGRRLVLKLVEASRKEELWKVITTKSYQVIRVNVILQFLD